MHTTLFTKITRRAPRACRSLTALLLAASALPAAAALAPAEVAVLHALYNSTNGVGWTNKTNWMNGGDPCAAGAPWEGITCNAAGDRVTVISLFSQNLTGTLPASLSSLTALQRLDVSHNSLTGPMPNLSPLTELRSVFVDNNQLTGTIPSLSGLTNLRFFDAEFNQFAGALPVLDGLAALEYFSARSNRLTGSIPSLSGLTELNMFHVSGNQLTGTIPSLSGLDSLDYFIVSGNQLTGSPPAAPPSLASEESALCPNYLAPPSPTDAEWDAATGDTPWHARCTTAPIYTVTVNAAPGTATPATASGAPGATPTFTLTAPAGHPVSQVVSSCGVPGGQPDAVTAGPLADFTTLALIGNCTVTVRYMGIDSVAVTAVPTLGEWSLMLLGLLAAGLGARRLRRVG